MPNADDDARSRAGGAGPAPTEVIVALTLLCALTSCVLDDTLPPGAVVVCTSDRECPRGSACDPVRHECTATGNDAKPPTLVSAAFDPPFADEGVVTLRIEANEALDVFATSFTLAGNELTFAPVDEDDAAVAPTFIADVTDAPEGATALVDVTLVDLFGNAAFFPVVNTAVAIDHTAPVVDIVAVHDGTPEDGSTFADIDPFDAIVVDVRVNEPITSAAARLGNVELTCAFEGDALAFACSGSLLVGAADGVGELIVEVTDRAGITGTTSRSVFVDASPPRVVASSVSIEILENGGGNAAQLAPGRAAVLRFVLDEAPVVETLSLSLRGPVDIPTQRVDVFGALVVASFAPSVVLAEGTYVPFIDTVEDAVGHVATDVRIDVTAPFDEGVVVVAIAGGPCPAAPTAPVPCPDFDGDGALGAGDGCPSGLIADCDDREPRAFDGAFDIPGDGIDNDCVGDGDAPLDETTAVFVDENFAGTSDGSRAAPFDDVTEAINAADGRVIATRGGFFGCPDGVNAPTGVIGGFDDDWQRDGSVTEFFCDITANRVVSGVQGDFFVIVNDAIVADIDATDLVASDVHAVNVSAEALSTSGISRVVGVQAEQLFVDGDVTDVVDAFISNGASLVAAVTTFVRADVAGGISVSEGELRAFHSVARNVGGPVVDCDGCGFTLVNTIVIGQPGGLAFELGVEGVSSTHGVLFDVPGGTIEFGFDADEAGVAAYNACGTCVADGNSVGEAIFIDARHHLANVANNDAIGAGVDPYLAAAGPPSIVRDIDGACTGIGDVWHAGLDVP